ncbi:MAG TPA: hypothetical protein VE862_04575 [Candidatus Acidoferrum sp.]|nr:hypothetical protein [Candidatus Acidoferrum sp.]
MVSIETLAFWKRKDLSLPEKQRIIPLPPLQSKGLAQINSMSEEEVARAKDALKVLLLEKQILASAITTIFESESKGIISQNERDHLVEKYKVDLTRLEKTIEEKQKIVDLHDLENARRELVKDYKSRMTEIEARIENLRSGNRPRDPTPLVPTHMPAQIMPVTRITETPRITLPVHHVETETTDAEKRIEQIRTEILQAMDRLEQIETEG